VKLQEFLPDIANSNKQLVQSNKMLSTVTDQGFVNYVKSTQASFGSRGMKSEVNYAGLETLYFDWL
jgi:hypothetical protein